MLFDSRLIQIVRFSVSYPRQGIAFKFHNYCTFRDYFTVGPDRMTLNGSRVSALTQKASSLALKLE